MAFVCASFAQQRDLRGKERSCCYHEGLRHGTNRSRVESWLESTIWCRRAGGLGSLGGSVACWHRVWGLGWVPPPVAVMRFSLGSSWAEDRAGSGERTQSMPSSDSRRQSGLGKLVQSTVRALDARVNHYRRPEIP